MTRDRLGILLFDGIRALVWGIVIVLLLVGATFLFGGQQNKLLRAVGCELGVPTTVIGHTPAGQEIVGRDPVVLKACWTDEGLAPPNYFDKA